MKNRNIIIAYLVVTLILLSEMILNLNKYSYAGYYSDKIIGWLWLAMTVFIIIKLWKKKAIKVYFGLLVGAIILSILPMLIPFFGIVSYFSTIGSYQRIQLDDHYRIDRNRPNVLYKPQITIYRREGIVEKQINIIPYNQVLEKVFQCSSIDLPVDDKEENIQKAKLIMANKDSIGIEYQIMNKKQIFYHKVNENWFE